LSFVAAAIAIGLLSGIIHRLIFSQPFAGLKPSKRLNSSSVPDQLFPGRKPISRIWRRGIKRKDITMQNDIHPKYEEMTATCSCGNQVKTRSTLGKDMHLDVCSACHPFYTGKQKMLDSGGRVDRFNKRFGNRSSKA
jgi:large subunit ribosomal protein L31|tara:strand:- start:246 stop:656 length:411 start_codon:yes stop_codon:yes gene_type:complete